jgi:hypothetical protein
VRSRVAEGGGDTEGDEEWINFEGASQKRGSDRERVSERRRNE